MKSQWMRTRILLGDKLVNQLSGKHILIAGLGGVGGYALEAVVRAGVGEITIIDHDVIDITNLNRQLIGTLNNLGKYKVDEFKARILSLNPECKLTVLREFINDENIPSILNDKPDYVIDCIDTINSKEALIMYCLQHKIKIISSMGAGNRIDVTKAKLADISKTKVCALARNLRLRLRKKGVKKGLLVAYSEEESFNAPLIEEGSSRPVNGTISYLPALFGILLSGQVIKDLINDAL